MRIETIRTLAGPNVHHHQPVLVAEIELDDLAGRESRELEGFNDRLRALLPGLAAHTCGGGYPGAFCERLDSGTYFGHIVEHVAIELSQQAGIPVCFGKTRLIAEPGRYRIVVCYRNEPGMRRLLRVAVDLVQAILDRREFPLEQELETTRALIERTQLGPSTQSIVDAALARGIPLRRLDQRRSLVELGYGRHRRLIQAAFTDGTSGVGAEIASDKALTKELLREAFVPVPAGRVVDTLEDALEQWNAMGGRATVKPVDGNHGNGVTTEVSSIEALRCAFENASRVASEVLVEEQLEGNDYRVLVVGGSMVAASLRRPPEVQGDGRRSVAELIEALNDDPLRGVGHEKPLSRVDVEDPVLQATLAAQEVALEDVPERGRVVRLASGANLSAGGTAADVTDEVHEDVRAVCERAARALGLDVCGIDLITPDIAQPFPGRGAGVVEVNTGPGLRMHLFPSAGRPRDAGAAIVDLLFPNGSDGRIPIVSITGTNGKTTVTRMIANAFTCAGKTVGVTTTSAIVVDGHELARGDLTGPASARAVLSDPAVEVAVLETARGGIVRRGLGYDWADVGVLTNLQPDHLGQDGIEDMEDLLFVKSLVAERVREGGTIVLNADDPLLMTIAQRPRVTEGRRVVLFSLDRTSFVLRSHLTSGGTAYAPRDGWIVEMSGQEKLPLLRIDAIPATFGGTATFNIANALAAVAACRALDTSPEVLREAFGRFGANSHNSGRLNVFDVERGKVVVDYGHNPAAFEALGAAVRRWTRGHVIGVIGAPGDRADHLLRDGARAAARVFDQVVIKEDENTRGRRRGEVAELLREAIAGERPDLPCEVVLPERDALERALDAMHQGDLVVMFYDDPGFVREVLEARGARPAASGASDAVSSPHRYRMARHDRHQER